jgi:hypothetical protein
VDESFCRDDETFRYHGKSKRSCKWIGTQEGGCDYTTTNNNGVVVTVVTVGTTYCPVTCNACPRTVAQSRIATDELCYMADGETNPQTIIVTFENAHPEREDWFGIYSVDDEHEHDSDIDVDDNRSSSSSSSIDESSSSSSRLLRQWTWLSGNRHEHHFTKASYGTIAVQAVLKPGVYRAVLARGGNHEGPYHIFATSEPFQTRFDACSARTRTRTLGDGGKHHHHHDEDHYHEKEEEDKEEDECATLTTTSSNSLAVDRTEYTVGEDIVVNLLVLPAETSSASPAVTAACRQQQQQLLASPDAFVGIYDADIAVDEIWGDANYETFLWTCGSRGCHNSEVVDTWVFGDDDTTVETTTTTTTRPLLMLLPPGTYRAHLVVPHGPRRFQSVAHSESFAVVEEPSSPLSS